MVLDVVGETMVVSESLVVSEAVVASEAMGKNAVGQMLWWF